MTQIQFYHLTTTPQERALPQLVKKAYEANYRVQLVLPSEEQVEYYNTQLWTFEQLAFLPHGSAKDPNPERQPVFLSTALESPNNANLLFVTDGSTPPKAEAYERIVDLFDGNNPASVEKARARWKHYKDAGQEVSYFKQNDKGAWEKAA